MAHLVNPSGWHTYVTLLKNVIDTFDRTRLGLVS